MANTYVGSYHLRALIEHSIRTIIMYVYVDVLEQTQP